MADPTSLAGFGRYANVNLDYDPTSTPEGQAFLQNLHQYDPNAKFQGQGGDQGGFSLMYDNGALPQNAYKENGFFGIRDVSPGWWQGTLLNGQNQGKDPVYGQITSAQNADVPDHSALARYGPMLALLMAGGVGAFAGTGLAGLGTAGALAKIPQTIGGIASGGFNPGSLLGLAGSMSGIPFGGTLGGLAGNMLTRSHGNG